MKVSSAWLRNWLGRTIISDAEIVSAMERAGIEVEQLIAPAPIDELVIVGVVKKVVQHPNAQRLKMVEVDVGDRLLHIVCGAPNVKSGMKVAVAQIGTILPGGDHIEQVKLRGEVSEGMICSEMELGLGKDHEGILDLDDASTVGARLCDIFTSDAVIDLKSPANRFDLQSVEGLAREVAAMTTATFHAYYPKAPIATRSGPEIASKPEVLRYMLLRLGVDQSEPTPGDMIGRLRASGMRCISPVVDVTNYVMLELGQPLHAFDAAKVKLPIDVRRARQAETLVTLDGVKRTLSPDDLVVADLTGPIALAGVMGGLATEVGDDTKEILLESAVFDAATVRKMALRHSLRSEASARMERGLSVQLPPRGAARAIELLSSVAHAKLEAVSDAEVRPYSARQISLRADLLSGLLGIPVTMSEAERALAKLDIGATSKAASKSSAIFDVPWWRPDIVVWQDLAEEVVRVKGYDQLPSTIPSWRPAKLSFDSAWAGRRALRDLLYGAGLFEVMTYSFVSAQQLEDHSLSASSHLKLKNPLSEEQAYLRSTLLASHLSVAERNRMYAKEFGFYEIARTFQSNGPSKQPDEPLRLAVTIRRNAGSYRAVKGILDSIAWTLGISLIAVQSELPNFGPGRSAEISLGDSVVGLIGQVEPGLVAAAKLDNEVAYLELDVESLLRQASPRQFAGLNRYPTIRRDLSLLLATETSWQAVRDAADPTRLEYVSDYYGSELPNGQKVMTVRFEVADPTRTPTEAEASDVETKLLAVLHRKVGATRRD